MITAEELLAFLTYLAEYEIIPRSYVGICAVNFTLSEIQNAITAMEERGEVYQAYLKKNSEGNADGSA